MQQGMQRGLGGGGGGAKDTSSGQRGVLLGGCLEDHGVQV